MDLLVLAQRQCPQSFSVQASPSECLSKEKTRNLTPAKGQDKTWLLEQSLDIRKKFKLGEAFSKGAKFFGVLLVIDKSSHLAAHSFWIGFRDFGPCHTPGAVPCKTKCALPEKLHLPPTKRQRLQFKGSKALDPQTAKQVRFLYLVPKEQ